MNVIITPEEFENQLRGTRNIDSYLIAMKVNLRPFTPVVTDYYETIEFPDMRLLAQEKVTFNHGRSRSSFTGKIIRGFGIDYEKKENITFEMLAGTLTNVRNISKTYIDLLLLDNQPRVFEFTIRKGLFLKKVDFSEELPLSVFLVNTPEDYNNQPEHLQQHMPNSYACMNPQLEYRL